METTLQLILDKLDSLDTKINNLEDKVNNIENKLNSMEKKVNKLDRKGINLEHEQKRQTDLLHPLIQNVANTNGRLTETNERLDHLEYKVDIISVDVKEIKSSMATKKDLEYYDQMISEHSREIYKLKNE